MFEATSKNHQAEGRMSFSEEKTQKSFMFGALPISYAAMREIAACEAGGHQKQKFFGSFFQKRTFLPCLAAIPRNKAVMS
jgi:hypothetical protein